MNASNRAPRSPRFALSAQLAGIFMLTWATQTYGFLTECARCVSTPHCTNLNPRAHTHTTQTAFAQVHLDAEGLRRQAKLQVPRGPLPAQEVCGGRDRLRRHQLLRGPQRPQAHRPDRVVLGARPFLCPHLPSVRRRIDNALALAGPAHVRHQGGARGGHARRRQHVAGLLARAFAAHGQLAAVRANRPNKVPARPAPDAMASLPTPARTGAWCRTSSAGSP